MERPVSVSHLLLCVPVSTPLAGSPQGAHVRNSWSQGLVFRQGFSLAARAGNDAFPAESWQPRPPQPHAEVCQLLLLLPPYFTPETQSFSLSGSGKGVTLDIYLTEPGSPFCNAHFLFERVEEFYSSGCWELTLLVQIFWARMQEGSTECLGQR